ncbi:MAG: hypothetical protein EHM79_07395 [Geobacter sp.]|nr:MAG: hypothetical protein EHM79_07395 [Geobacter sp.]
MGHRRGGWPHLLSHRRVDRPTGQCFDSLAFLCYWRSLRRDPRRGTVEGGDTSVNNCYATGRVTGATNIGGLVGYLRTEPTLANSYATGAVISLNGGDGVGGLVGRNDHPDGGSNVSSSFWDIDATGQPASAGGAGRSTELMRQQATFADWDFPGLWKINEGASYPYLNWQSFSTLAPALRAPANDETVAELRPTLTWLPLQHPADREVVAYEIQVSTTPDFTEEDTNSWMVWLIEPEFSRFGLAALLLVSTPLARRNNRRRLALLALVGLCATLLVSGCGDSSRPAPLVDDEEAAAAVVSFTPEEDLVPGTTYYWRVRALDDQNQWSAWSQTWSWQAPGGER